MLLTAQSVRVQDEMQDIVVEGPLPLNSGSAFHQNHCSSPSQELTIDASTAFHSASSSPSTLNDSLAEPEISFSSGAGSGMMSGNAEGMLY